MIIKKFTGKTEDEALRAARSELGNQAVIMNVKKLKKKGIMGLFSKPVIEVTAAVEEEQDGYDAPVKTDLRKGKSTPGAAYDHKAGKENELTKYKDVLTDEEYEKLHPQKKEDKAPVQDDRSKDKLENLHTFIEQQLKTVMDADADMSEKADQKKNSGNKEIMSFIKLIYTTLINNEVDEKYANDLVEEVEKLSKPGVTIDYLLSNIYQKLILKFGVSSGIRGSEEGPKLIFFLGPTGVGKTTTIAKIASEEAVSKKKKVALITSDTYRIKAAEQLRTYAEIMDVPFRVVYTAEDLENAIEEFNDMDFIFVDTAGYSPKDKEKRAEMKDLLDAAKSVSDMETYLVLSITTKYRDLLSICDTYKEMGEFRLIFTKLDETSTFGNIYNIRVYTGAEISYVTDGQDVPDDIEVFNPQSIVRAILGGS